MFGKDNSGLPLFDVGLGMKAGIRFCWKLGGPLFLCSSKSELCNHLVEEVGPVFKQDTGGEG